VLGAVGRCRRRAGGHADADDHRRQREGDRVAEQRGGRAHGGDEQPTEREADHLRRLVGDLPDREAALVQLASEDLGVERPLRRGVRRAEQHDNDQEGAQRPQWQARHRHHGDEHGAQHVRGDHDLAAAVPVGEPGEQHSAGERREEGQGVGDCGPQRGAGAAVHQHHQRDPGELVARDRGQLGRPHHPELRHAEDRAQPATRHAVVPPSTSAGCIRATHRV
jgi:hypothetical protein